MWWGLGAPMTTWKCRRILELELTLLTLCAFLINETSTKILHLSVPRAVNVDETDEAILDCLYDYSKDLDDHLIVKWFFNDNRSPIYTWLPASDSRTFDSHFEQFFDKTYRFSQDRYQRFRGIRFGHLHPNLTGVYYCSVASKHGFFEERKPMTLYRVPRFQRFDVHPIRSGFEISCDVDRIIRPAEIRIYRVRQGHLVPLDIAITLLQLPSLSAHITANYSVTRSETKSLFEFQCVVSYPNTDINSTTSRLSTFSNAAPRASTSTAFILCIILYIVSF